MFWLLLPFIMHGVTTNFHSSVVKLFDMSYVEQELRGCHQELADMSNRVTIQKTLTVSLQSIRTFVFSQQILYLISLSRTKYTLRFQTGRTWEIKLASIINKFNIKTRSSGKN
jgi:hypothetical protein